MKFSYQLLFRNASIDTRFALDDQNNKNDDDDDDDESPCEVTKSSYAPKALNNIYNKLIPIYQDTSLVQTITIEKCL